MDICAKELVMENFISKMNKIQKAVDEAMKEAAAAREEVKDSNARANTLEQKLAEKDRELRKTKEQLLYAHQNKFGDKRQKVGKSKFKETPPDRQDEKDHFDGTGANDGKVLGQKKF